MSDSTTERLLIARDFIDKAITARQRCDFKTLLDEITVAREKLAEAAHTTERQLDAERLRG